MSQHQIVEHRYYVYILASKSRTLYIGVTNNLRARILQHRRGEIGGFTSDYKVHRLVYFEQHTWIQNAIAREKQLKRWRRAKKTWLIERENPTWEDLAADWGKPVRLIKRNPTNTEDSRVPPTPRPPTRTTTPTSANGALVGDPGDAGGKNIADAPVGMTHR